MDLAERGKTAAIRARARSRAGELLQTAKEQYRKAEDDVIARSGDRYANVERTDITRQFYKPLAGELQPLVMAGAKAVETVTGGEGMVKKVGEFFDKEFKTSILDMKIDQIGKGKGKDPEDQKKMTVKTAPNKLMQTDPASRYAPCGVADAGR